MNGRNTTDQWALNFVDTKSQRVLALPIEETLGRAIREQQVRIERDPRRQGQERPSLLFPNPRASISGQYSAANINLVIQRWVERLGIKSEVGEPLRITSHQFRHTFATELVGKNVPLEVIKELLGHRSIKTTEVYATVTGDHLRREWQKAKAVDIHGHQVELPDGPAGDAEWLLHRVGKAVSPLPNGYCGRPIQRSCPERNVCLECDDFLTTPEFLPTLKAQRAQHVEFITKGESEGHVRLVQLNEGPKRSLDRIIETIEEHIADE